MATITTHTLNSTDGSHAGGIMITLHRLDAGGAVQLLASETDAGGRLSAEVDLGGANPAATYELVMQTAPYWTARGLPTDGARIIAEIVLRFRMEDPEGKYHMPVILSPNGYSTWASA